MCQSNKYSHSYKEQSQTCEGPVTESKLLNALKIMLNDKSPGNEGLTKEFCKTFWEEIKIRLCDKQNNVKMEN